VLAPSNRQIWNFAGNAIDLQDKDGRLPALSTTAPTALTPEQLEIIAQSATCVALDIPTIERAGGQCGVRWRECT